MLKYTALILLILPWALSAESSVWRVSKNDNSFYIGGTCHLLRSSDYPLPAEFELAYALANTLVFEMDPAVASNPSFAFQLLRASSYTDQDSLKTVLSKKTYKLLAKQCERSGFSIEAVNKTKPGMLMMMLLVKELANYNVIQEGVDVHYHARGLNDKKKVLALETAEFQIELIASFGEGMEDKMVLYGLKDIDNLKANFDLLINAWRKGDLKKIEKHFVDGIRAYPKLYSELLVDRNKQWMNSLEILMETPETEFVLVGLAHIPGKKGLLSLLKKRGYAIEKISVPL